MSTNSRSIWKIIISITVVAVVVVGVYLISVSIYRSDKTKVTVNVVPDTAEITFNDQRISNGVQYLEPGYYKVKINHDGFLPHEESVEIGQAPQIVNIALTPDSDEASAWLSENEEQYLGYEQLAGQQAIREGAIVAEKNPIISKLPFRNLLFTIGYRADTSDSTGQSIIVEIDAVKGYRQSAINQIDNWGYDPAELNINFRNYQNPFSL